LAPVVTATLAAPAAPLSFSFTSGPVAVTAHGANALLRFAVSSSAPASLQATLNRGTRTLHRWRVAAPAGKRTLSLALPKRLLRAGTYRLVVSAAGPSGQTVVRTVVVHVPARLKQG
jgi:hypothetical protein